MKNSGSNFENEEIVTERKSVVMKERILRRDCNLPKQSDPQNKQDIGDAVCIKKANFHTEPEMLSGKENIVHTKYGKGK